MEKYDFIERLFKDEISDELFFGVKNLEVLYARLPLVLFLTECLKGGGTDHRELRVVAPDHWVELQGS